MAEHLGVAPEQLRATARLHRDTAEALREIPAGNTGIMSSLTSLGPIFAELREAGRELLDQRRACYERQAVAHEDLAQRLDRAAAVWEQHDGDAARQMRSVTGKLT